MTIPLPQTYRPAQLSRVLGSVLDYDQLDDWLPDPIYYRDVAEDQAAFLSEIEKSRSLDLTGAHVVSILSRGEQKFAAAALPLPARVVAADMIASQAATIQKRLLGNHVYGWRYQTGEQAYNKFWSIDVFAPEATGYFESLCSDEPGSIRPAVDTSGAALRPKAMFTSMGEGLSDCLHDVLAYFEAQAPELYAEWCDVSSFYPSIDRPLLWEILKELHFDPEIATALEAVLTGLGQRSGFVSADDAWGFLANFYLTRVDEALANAQIHFKRYADEYFLLGTNAAALDTGRARLVPALKSVKLALNSKKTLRIQGGYKNLPCIDPSSGNCDGTPYDLDGFMFEIIQKATSRVECESGNAAFAGRVNLGNWPDAMKEILSQPAGSAPLNSTFHLLRTTHLARREDVLHAGIDTKKAPAPRGKAYRQALASIPSIGDLLAKRLQESLSGQLWWHCLWLTSLASDLVAERPDMATALFAPITKLANSATDPVVKAQAVVALARGEKPPLAKALAKGLAPTGAPLVHRRLAVAAYYLDKRFGGTTLDRFKTSESRLFKFLRKARST